MPSKKAWLWGCGSGCALLVLAAIAIPAATVWMMSGTMQGFDQAVASREALEERFGRNDAFVPPADGMIPAERIDAFLQVREAMQPSRDSLANRFETLFVSAAEAENIEDKGTIEKIKFAMGMGKTAIGMAPDLGTFFEARNTALLDTPMGLGEYTYLYGMAYFAVLQLSPGAGPAALTENLDDNVDIDIDMSMNSALSRVRRELRKMVESQHRTLDAATATPEWRQAIEAEIAAMQRDRARIPWQDGAPPTMAAAFEPFRERLTATYSPATNPFELSRNEKRGKFSYTSD